MPQRSARSKSFMRKTIRFLALPILAQVLLLCLAWRAQAQGQSAPYPVMDPIRVYLISNAASEIALARSAAPASISDGAEAMVLGQEGYTTAAKGKNGFLCIVERSWGAATDDPDFWNPKFAHPSALIPQPRELMRPLLDEDQTGLGWKIKDANRSHDRVCARWAGIACAGARRNVLHDVHAAILKRFGRELASTTSYDPLSDQLKAYVR